MSTNSRSARNRNRASDNKCPISPFKLRLVSNCERISPNNSSLCSFPDFVWEAIRKAFRYKVKTFARLMKCWRDFVVVVVVLAKLDMVSLRAATKVRRKETKDDVVFFFLKP